MLLLLLFLHQAWSEDVPKDSYFTLKKTDACPEVGYYFSREHHPNALQGCFLCFCQNDGTSYCWRRDNRNCDGNNVRMKRRRPPRSPGFGDIFFKDAANSFFGTQAVGECTPYESSFSDDCPPADWCTGCTVCDCTTNGKWECHLLSFCPDGQGKKTVKKRKPKEKASLQRKNSANILNLTPLTTQKVPPSTSKTNKIIKKSIPVGVNNNQTTKRRKIVVKLKNKPKKNMPKQPMYIKKSIKMPVEIKNYKPKFISKPDHNVDPRQMAKKVVKRVIAAVTKIMKNEIKSNKTKTFNKTQGRSVKKTDNEKNRKPNTKLRFIKKHGKKVVNAVTTSARKISHDKRVKRSILLHVANVTETPVTNTTNTEGKIRLIVENITVIASTMMPTTEENISVQTKVVLKDFGVTGVLSSYYKYVLDDKLNNKSEVLNLHTSLTNTSSDSIDNKLNESINIVEINQNTIRPFKTMNDKILENNKSNTLLSLSDILSANDIKNKRWSRIKLVKENKLKINSWKIKNNSTTKRKTIKQKNFAQKLGIPKYGVQKIINTNKEIRVKSDTTKATSNKVNDLQKFVGNVLINLNGYNTKSNVAKTKKNVLRFMKTYFKKIFGIGEKRSNKYNITFDKHHIIETICENFGPCKINARNRLLVKNKIDELHTQIIEIFRSIQILKGLLKLTDIPIIDTDPNGGSNKLRDDLKKLSIILKGQYLKTNLPLTNTQIILVEYIVNYTNIFINVLSKFAISLNETVALVTNHEKNKRDLLKSRLNNDNWKNIKNLLLKFNIVQNRFIRSLYQMIFRAESRSKWNKEVTRDNYISEETYSKNIINKLRKLKNFASLLNSKRSRKKRQVIEDDDALEYMLMLMEYLMKQNYPSKVPPNDGIDLLIDAIRNTPDIKLIKKKVLESTPLNIIPIRTVKPTAENGKKNLKIDEELNKEQRVNVSNYNHRKHYYVEDRNLNTEEVINNKINNTAENEINTFQIDEETNEVGKFNVSDDGYKYLTYTPFIKEKESNIEELSNENYNETGQIIKLERKFVPIEDFEDNSDDRYDYKRKNINRFELSGVREETAPKSEYSAETPKTKESKESVKVIQFELYPDIDENIAMAHILETTTYKTDGYEKPIDAEETMQPNTNNSFEILDKYSKLDWIAENFDAKSLKVDNITDPLLIPTSTARVSVVTSQSQLESSLTTKVEEEKGSKMKSEEVLLKKQINLLNSLDYVTEKAENIESSRDGSDRDSDSAYFF